MTQSQVHAQRLRLPHPRIHEFDARTDQKISFVKWDITYVSQVAVHYRRSGFPRPKMADEKSYALLHPPSSSFASSFE